MGRRLDFASANRPQRLDRDRRNPVYDAQFHEVPGSSLGIKLQALYSTQERRRPMERLSQNVWHYQSIAGRRTRWHNQHRKWKALSRETVRPGKVRQTDRTKRGIPADWRSRY